MSKRNRLHNLDASDDSDDDFGPTPASSAEDEEIVDESKSSSIKKKQKIRKLEFEQLFLDNLPVANTYERSFMHRDVVSHIAVSKSCDFVITGSIDGHIKFWKKMVENIEFVKAHIARINAFELSPDGQKLLTTSNDRMVKFFEVISFDMANMLSLPYVPTAAVWLKATTGLYVHVAIADETSGTVRIYSSEGGQQPLSELTLHSSPVSCMAYNHNAHTVISADARSMIEYWSPSTLVAPNQASGVVSFRFKSDTDLYDLAKCKTTALSLVISPKGDCFVITARDCRVRLFDFKSGKLRRTYDESSAVYQTGNTAANAGIDALEMGKRLAMERELQATDDENGLGLCRPAFDESGNFLVYSSAVGIKILNVVTNRVARVLGVPESSERFMAVALYQGVPKVDAQFLLSRASGSDPKTAEQLRETPKADPTVYCTSFKRRRFYCFSKREPNEILEPRDVLNEMPTDEEKLTAQDLSVGRSLSNVAVMRTSLGDITLKLFAAECPRTTENFLTHARNGYYNDVIFHRVIKGFMIQTGDPLGDGTGGESIWGGEFEDEFVRGLRHDRPFTLSMANSGPNTNGSQFFITTVPTPWLDNKHTVFGRVSAGFDVVTKLENVRVNKSDRPYETVRILSIDVPTGNGGSSDD